MTPDFENNLKDAMVSAMSALELTTAIVLKDINSNWKTGDPLIRDLLKPVTTGFQHASAIVEHDLIRISRRTQEGSAAEQSVRKFLNSLDEHRRYLELWQESCSRKSENINRYIAERSLRFSIPVFFRFGRNEDLFYTEELPRKLNSAPKLYLGRLRGLRDKTVDLLNTTCVDENRLIDIKMSITNIITKVHRLENYVTSSKISFSPRKFIQCVLELLRSEEMKSVERQLQLVGNNIVQKRESITNSCRLQLSPEIWSEVQQPYVHTGDDDFTVLEFESTIPPSQILSLLHEIRAQA